MSIKEVAIAPTLGREDRQRSVGITANLNDGVVLGDAVKEMEAIAPSVLGPNMSITLTGEAKTLARDDAEHGVCLRIALLIVFLVLAAQFESITSALVILFTVPFGLAAAALAIKLTGGTSQRLQPDRLRPRRRRHGEERHSDRRVRQHPARRRGNPVDEAIREATRTRSVRS